MFSYSIRIQTTSLTFRKNSIKEMVKNTATSNELVDPVCMNVYRFWTEHLNQQVGKKEWNNKQSTLADEPNNQQSLWENKDEELKCCICKRIRAAAASQSISLPN